MINDMYRVELWSGDRCFYTSSEDVKGFGAAERKAEYLVVEKTGLHSWVVRDSKWKKHPWNEMWFKCYFDDNGVNSYQENTVIINKAKNGTE